ncbi:hypothetical protein BVY04_03115 [bacterium M21]|nr:hypothetical protein BVY04_03115 [bacterium M21]
MREDPEDMEPTGTLASYEEPFADSSMLPSVLVSAFARKHVSVSLSGDAADELFGGYYRYQVSHQFNRFSFLPLALRRMISGTINMVLPSMAEERTLTRKLRRAAKPFGADGIERYLDIISRFPNDQRQSIYGPSMRTASLQTSAEFLKAKSGKELRHINELIELELQTYLNDDILVKVDRASMAHSLEVRSPFLDPTVVDFATSLPFSFKQSGGVRKRILADTFRDMLPPEIFARRKMGFGVPIASWLRTSWQARANELLLEGKRCKDGLFERRGLEQLLTAHQQKSADNSYAIYALMVLAIWLEK